MLPIITQGIHSFFRFLSTTEGALFKHFLELTLFTIIAYMIISEYKRTCEREMKFLAVGFGCLMVQKSILTLYLWYHVFTKTPLLMSQSRMPLIANFLEIFALIWFANAFLYPFYRKRQKEFKQKIIIEILVTFSAIIAVGIIWSIILANTEVRVNFYVFKGNLFLLAIKTFFLLMPVVFLTHFVKKKFKHKTSIILAFTTYAITPLVEMVNFGMFIGEHPQLKGIVHPFPILSILLFTRVIYLKLADKVTLRERLKVSEQKYLEAQEINKLKDEFVSVISHELKTPLTSIKLYLSMLKNKELGELSKDQLNAVSIVKEETDRLTNLVMDVLDLSKLEANKTKINKEKLDIVALLSENTQFKHAENKGITIEKRFPPELIVPVDGAKFQQIFANLLSNAIKHTDKGGTITLALDETTSTWSFCITDTGVGIPKEKIPKLFKKFYQVDDYMTRKHSGTGLGLAIVEGLVHLHSGEIKVQSKVGVGTKFTLRFPKANK